MTQQYTLGELSVRLEALQAVGGSAATELARLRQEAETGPPWALTPVIRRALALGENMCWDSLCSGDTAAFTRRAEICAELHRFGVCARLLAE